MVLPPMLASLRYKREEYSCTSDAEGPSSRTRCRPAPSAAGRRPALCEKARARASETPLQMRPPPLRSDPRRLGGEGRACGPGDCPAPRRELWHEAARRLERQPLLADGGPRRGAGAAREQRVQEGRVSRGGKKKSPISRIKSDPGRRSHWPVVPRAARSPARAARTGPQLGLGGRRSRAENRRVREKKKKRAPRVCARPGRQTARGRHARCAAAAAPARSPLPALG